MIPLALVTPQQQFLQVWGWRWHDVINNNPREVVAIIGDGAMTAGIAFEAMNDAVAHQADIMVVLNDNDMSISCSTGGFAKHLAAIWERGAIGLCQ